MTRPTCLSNHHKEHQTCSVAISRCSTSSCLLPSIISRQRSKWRKVRHHLQRWRQHPATLVSRQSKILSQHVKIHLKRYAPCIEKKYPDPNSSAGARYDETEIKLSPNVFECCRCRLEPHDIHDTDTGNANVHAFSSRLGWKEFVNIRKLRPIQRHLVWKQIEIEHSNCCPERSGVCRVREMATRAACFQHTPVCQCTNGRYTGTYWSQ